MSEETDRYGERLAEYESASQNAGVLAKAIEEFHNAVEYNFLAFMQETYGMNLGVRDANRPVRFNMAGWPDRAAVDAAFQGLAKAFLEMHTAWRDVPEKSRSFLREPPPKPSLTKPTPKR